MDIEATIGRRLDALAGGVRGLQDQLAATAEERARLRGIKFIRLAVVRGTASGSALTMGGDTGQAFANPRTGLCLVGAASGGGGHGHGRHPRRG